MFDRKPTNYSEMYSLIKPSKRFEVLSLDPYVAKGRIAMAYRYFPGAIATRFFVELRDNQRIMGIKCTRCNIVYVPVESTCGQCFDKLEELVEVGKEGVLESYTITNYRLLDPSNAAQIIYGLIKLDGADTCLLHILGEADPSSLRIGARVEAVFKEIRQGNILDIQYFRPVE
jgi:uncharacterized protein